MYQCPGATTRKYHKSGSLKQQMNPWCALACRCTTAVCPHHHISVCSLPLFIRTPVTGWTSMPGAGVRSSTHGKGHEEGGSAYAKVRSSLRSPSGNSRASTPKTRVCYFLLCALTYTSDFMGGCPPLSLSEKRVNLQLQLIIPGCDSFSTYKLLWKSSSLPE